MDQQKTGALIRALRTQRGLTQRELGAAVGVGDKAISKWERGLGCPDVSLLSALSRALEVDVERLLSGDLSPNGMDGGNMKRIQFYRCPVCGCILTGSGQAQVSCCGRPLASLAPRQADEAHALWTEPMEEDLWLSFSHPMRKDHFLCFAALANLDRVVLVRLYPEGADELRIPHLRGGGTLYWCCSEHGLFSQKVT